MILDEAQNIKNFKSQRWQLMLNIRTAHRLLLTGTPLQNSLMELWALMHFLMPQVRVRAHLRTHSCRSGVRFASRF
jgi:SNF2 family DNA or RNA helicase